MEINIIVGFLVAFVAFYFGVPDLRENYAIYLDPLSFLLVFGGTIASTIISNPLSIIKRLFQSAKLLFFRPNFTASKAVETLVAISEKAQSARKQDLVKEGRGVDDGFLERGLSMMADGLDKEFIQRTLETDIDELQSRHAQVINAVRTMGTFAPMFGMMGTVIGVTQVLQNVTDVNTIVSGMSLALLTTLYGLVLSSVLFIPIANKLKRIDEQEVLTKLIVMEGLMAIIDREIPLKVRKTLESYVAGKEKTIVGS